MKVLVRWRVEGDMVIDTNNLDTGCDKVHEIVTAMVSPIQVGQLGYGPILQGMTSENPEIIDAKIVSGS